MNQVEKLLTAGKLLRDVRACVEWKSRTRQFLGPILVSTSTVDIRDAFEDLAEEAAKIVDDIGEGKTEPEYAWCLLVLRDDMESFLYALAASLVWSRSYLDDDQLAHINLTRLEMMQSCESLDRRAKEISPAIRETLRGARGVDLSSLWARVSSGENPWWIDLVDPMFL